jgi:2-dehydropantoate 2-reductase
MRIAVMGSGGTGGYFGGLLSRAGEEVTFITRGAHLEALRLRGLKVKSRLAGEFTLPVRAVATPNEVGPVDLILFCVKTYDTDAAAESIRPLIGADTMLLSLQNGVDNAEHIARIAGHDSGLGSAAYVVSAIEAPGVIAQTAGPGKIILGALGGGMGARIERLQDVLQRAEISAEVHSDDRIAIWQKFLFICAFSGVTALTRMSIGPSLADQATHALFRGALEETEAVARGGGIALPEDCVEQALATATAVEPWGRSSLYHDLAHERRLELEALNGEVVHPYWRDLPATRRQLRRVRRRRPLRQLGRGCSRGGAGCPPSEPCRRTIRPGQTAVGPSAARHARAAAHRVARSALTCASWRYPLHGFPGDLQRQPPPDRGFPRGADTGYDTALERVTFTCNAE